MKHLMEKRSVFILVTIILGVIMISSAVNAQDKDIEKRKQPFRREGDGRTGPEVVFLTSATF